LAIDNLFLQQAAASQPTQSTLMWLVWFLCKHPRVQARCRAELRAHGLAAGAGSPPPALSAAAVDALVYHEAVVKETFRLGMATPGGVRVASEDCQLGDMHIKKGQQIMWSNAVVQRDAQWWTPDALAGQSGEQGTADNFYPERFVDAAQLPPLCDADWGGLPRPAESLDEAGAHAAGVDTSHLTQAFLPFGGGVHACPGWRMGWNVVKVSCIRMMQRGIQFHDTALNCAQTQHRQRVATFPLQVAPNIRMDRQEN